MIKKLQRKFIMITMLSLLAVITLLVGTINIVNIYTTNKTADNLLMVLSENDGQFPDENRPHMNERNIRKPEQFMSPETRFETRYFSVEVDEDGSITEIDTGHIAAISSDEAKTYAEQVIKNNKRTGFCDSYKYLVSIDEDETTIVFLDCTKDINTITSFLWVSCLVAVASLLLVFLLVSILSSRAVRPVIKNIEKQKQFITDAGHEIKTPLSIINANTDVIEMENGVSEWTKSTKNQITRLSGLVANMLTLSKIDEGGESLVFMDISLSDEVASALEPFLLIAEQRQIYFDINISPGIHIHADANSINELVSILTDNALKYVSEDGKINLTLLTSGKSKIFSISNTCDEPAEKDLSRLFDRFYRSDASRSRQSGGYGIGLSVAQAIVQAHNGKISAEYMNGKMTFTVIFN